MSVLNALVPTMTGLGLFFCGVRFVASNLSILAGASARRLFRTALSSHWLAACSGIVSGLLTQSTNAVSLIVVSFARAGIVTGKRAPLLPIWSHVGASALVFLVALNTRYLVADLLLLSGIALYFDFRLSDRMRHSVMTILGAGMLLLGLIILKSGSGQLQGILLDLGLLGPDSSAIGTLLLGVALALATQSSTVAGAIAVALLGAGVFGLDTAILLMLGANGGSGLNYALMARSGEATGRHILLFQSIQKLSGTLVLLLPVVLSAQALHQWLLALPMDDAHRLAMAFLVVQVAGSMVCTVALWPLTKALHRLIPARHEDDLAKPAHLVEEALDDVDLALELAQRESLRLLQRLPMMLEKVREGGDANAIPAATYRQAGAAVGTELSRYLAAILDRQPGPRAIIRAMSLQQSVTNLISMHGALAEFATLAAVACETSGTQTTMGHITESLHMLLSMQAEAAVSRDPDEQRRILALLGQRDQLMESIRGRLLTQDSDTPPQAQQALFQATILFERIVWLARDSQLAWMRDTGEENPAAG